MRKPVLPLASPTAAKSLALTEPMLTVKSLPPPGVPPLTVHVMLVMSPVKVTVPVAANADGAARPANSSAERVALRFIQLTFDDCIDRRPGTADGLGRHGFSPRITQPCSTHRERRRSLSDYPYIPYGIKL